MSTHSNPCLCVNITFEESVEEMWLTEIRCRQITPEQMIAELRLDAMEPDMDPEDVEWLMDQADLIENMLHA